MSVDGYNDHLMFLCDLQFEKSALLESLKKKEIELNEKIRVAGKELASVKSQKLETYEKLEEVQRELKGYVDSGDMEEE